MSYIVGQEKFRVFKFIRPAGGPVGYLTPPSQVSTPMVAYDTGPEVVVERIAPGTSHEQYASQYVSQCVDGTPTTTTTTPGAVWGSRVRDMKLSTCIIIALVIGIVVIGASVGGAIGGTAALREKPSQPSQPSPSDQDSTASSPPISPTTSASRSTTPSSTAPASPTPTFSTDCPSSNRTTYTSRFGTGGDGAVTPAMGLTFRKLCAVDRTAANVAQATVASFDLCIEVCASLNFWANSAAACTAVAYAVGNGACWASNATLSTRLNDAISGAELIPNA
ncbi:hypothetical protein F5X98DRAFT_378985 [Xylaria grammica]|nr:hypothetical protein F5X98DRAFT_378985 [Xylaria grammica]